MDASVGTTRKKVVKILGTACLAAGMAALSAVAASNIQREKENHYGEIKIDKGK